MLLNFAITAAEIIGGLLSGSLALLSDAVHNFSDGISIVISYAAIKLRDRFGIGHVTLHVECSPCPDARLINRRKPA